MATNNSPSSSGGFGSEESGQNSDWDRLLKSNYPELFDNDRFENKFPIWFEEPEKKKAELRLDPKLPVPYPKYPTLIDRSISPSVRRFIKEHYNLDGSIFDTPSRSNIEDGASDCLYSCPFISKHIQGQHSFIHALEYFLCLHLKMNNAPLLNLTLVKRCARGSIVRNVEEEFEVIEGLEGETVDQILESALQQRDFKAIRAVLNYEGYGVPTEEPNELQVLPELREIAEEDLEFEITTEEYQEWEAPLEEIPSNQSATQTSELQQLFATTMTNNVHLHLERAIRERDIETLRMLLRLYGHDIAADQPNIPREENDSSIDI